MRARWKVFRAVAAFILPATLLLCWSLLYEAKSKTMTVVASPSQVARTLLKDREELWTNTTMSLSRLLAGVAIGAALGTASGLTLARVRILRTLLSPTLQVLAA